MSPEPPNQDYQRQSQQWCRCQSNYITGQDGLCDMCRHRQQHYVQAEFDSLTAEVARLTAERDALQQQVKALQDENQIKDAAVEGAIRRAERAESRLEIATELLKAQTMEHYFK